MGGEWTCRAVTGPVPEPIAATLAQGIPGAVPGVVHLDLLTAGLVPDPYEGRNEHELTWIGRTDWEYSRSFEWSVGAHTRHELVAEGLDTVATIRLNGQEVGRTANHHRTHRFDVGALLVEGTNRISIRFTAALNHAEERERVLGARPHSNAHPFNTIRKPAYAFGWDWGPELVTAGIWRAIRLESSTAARLARVRPLTGWTHAGATLDLHVAVEHASQPHTVRVAVGELASASAELLGDGHLALAVPGADPWWPRSHGEQTLYDVAVTLLDAADEVVDSWTGRVGFRTVTVDTSADEVGNRFAITVNGVPVHIRGANWIPADNFLPRVDRPRLAAALSDAVEANMNLVRVWGGGIYESDDFYDLCDELGLLVWQDFALACAAYSEEPELWDEFEAEAREAIVRISGHASLALFNGGNENIWGWADWGWRALLDGASWGQGYYLELFPGLVAELAPGTAYVEGSPFSFDRFLHPNDDINGCMHIWTVWNDDDYTTYRNFRPRFVSEFGFQGPPAFSTLESVVRDVPRSPLGAEMLSHQKAEDGNLKLARGLGDHLPMPAEYLDWHWATQLNQARAVRFGIEHFRSLAPFNTGSVVWQLGDCWPVVSWAAVDGHGIRKPLWFALRAAFADRLATIQPRDGGLALVLHNESDQLWETTAGLSRVALTGAELAAARVSLAVPARGSLTVAIPAEVTSPDRADHELLVADLASGERALWYFVEDPELALSDDAFDASVEPTEGGYLVTVTAQALVKDLMLLVDHLDPAATVDIGLVTLLAGESATFRVSSRLPLDDAALVSRPVLRTANDLVAEARRPAADPAETEAADDVLAVMGTLIGGSRDTDGALVPAESSAGRLEP
nr:glycoside hydrolase family 2 protein [Tessaracoccus sp. OS52]